MRSPEEILELLQGKRIVLPPEPRTIGMVDRVKSFDFKSFSEISADLSREYWLIDDLLPRQNLSVIFGPPKSRKSAIALDVALSIATGRAWGGKWVFQGAALYIGIEDQLGTSMVIQAYRDHHRLNGAKVPFYLSSVAPNFGSVSGDRQALIGEVEVLIQKFGIVPRIIVVDTLARTLGGASENAEGMVAFVENCEKLAQHFGCAVLAVHHSPHDQDRMRGYSVLHGSVMSSWMVKKADTEETFASDVKLVDMKAGASGLAWKVTFSIHELPPNSRGKAHEVQLVEEVLPPKVDIATPKKISAISQSMRLFFSCFDVALGDHGIDVAPLDASYQGCKVRAVPLEKVYEEFSRRYVEERGTEGKVKPGSIRRAFMRKVQSALDSRAICRDEVTGCLGDYLWRGRQQ
jgi:hypothetical protein